ncbi:hypothetical protein B0H10DRAFT_2235119 [Mycena sp. CBHHK59/15]|nr:hypothetical protein B0H10DRAFT_2235119 [Mycena sp. CBHHK59/15]
MSALDRPQMRRKSSAQNLLSSFKTTQPPPTPTVSTPTPKEFDAQSLYSDTTTLSNPQGQQGTSVEYLRDLVQKRIITLTYVRNIHEGRSHWFHTIMISRADLDRVFNNTDMKKRTYRFAILGMSLSGLLDITSPQDLLKGLINTLSEYEQAREDSDKPKIRTTKRLFRSKKRPGTFPDYIGSYGDASDAYLVSPHIPFPLDYHQTLLSLLDVLSEVYNKIAKLLGPSPFPHAPQSMMGPLGLLAPHPGVSYLFSPDATAYASAAFNNTPAPYNNNPYATPYNGGGGSSNNLTPTAHVDGLPNNGGLHPNTGANTGAASLWDIAHAGSTSLWDAGGGGVWTAGLGELVLKIDGKFKKITSALLKELDQFARRGIRDELASLDPLLRHISAGTEEGGRGVYEFEGM